VGKETGDTGERRGFGPLTEDNRKSLIAMWGFEYSLSETGLSDDGVIEILMNTQAPSERKVGEIILDTARERPVDMRDRMFSRETMARLIAARRPCLAPTMCMDAVESLQ
jgi:hypothetical protein